MYIMLYYLFPITAVIETGSQCRPIWYHNYVLQQTFCFCVILQENQLSSSKTVYTSIYTIDQ